MTELIFNNEKWFVEKVDDPISPENTTIILKIKEKLFSGQSEYQKIDVYETYDFGRLLVLDGLIMTTERDEYIYHEMMSHIPLFTHPNPKNVLIIGGGDGGVLKEVVKHPCVEKAHLCEIDKMVVEKCRVYFHFFDGIIDLPQVKLYYEDGFHFLKEHKDVYDLIIVDSTDPVGEAEKLFELSFYKLCHEALNDEGILTIQSESPFYSADIIKDLKLKFETLFPVCKIYIAMIPTYPGGNWSFMLGSKKYNPLTDYRKTDYQNLKLNLNYYNDAIHRGCFLLPNYLIKALA